MSGANPETSWVALITACDLIQPVNTTCGLENHLIHVTVLSKNPSKNDACSVHLPSEPSLEPGPSSK